MDLKKYAFFILLVFSANLNLFAFDDYNFTFRNIGVEQGLSQNMIYSIMQDQTGFLWFGTQDGLNRFDGLNFKIFKTDNNGNKNNIGSNAIFSLCEDHENKIWIGTSNGIYIYNSKYESFQEFRIKIKNKTYDGIVRDIRKDANNNIWFCIEGGMIGCYSGTSKKMKIFQLPNIVFRKICFDHQGNIWLATHGNGLIKLYPAIGKYTHYPITNNLSYRAENDVNDICFINNNQAVVGTSSKGLLLFDLRTGKYSPFLDSNEYKNLYVRSIYKASDQTLWIGTESGIVLFDLRTKKALHIQHSFNDPYSLSDNAVHSIYQDREENMWIGTFFGGVNFYSPSFSSFKKYYPVVNKNSISGKSISEFCEDEHRNIWIGTEDAGLNLYNVKNSQFTEGIIPAKNIHSLLYNNDRLWVGTFSQGLFVVNTINKKIEKHYKSSLNSNSLLDNNIYSIYKDSSGKIWIGTMTGLHYFDVNSDSFVRVKEGEINTQVNDIIEDFKGELWFATMGDGVYSYNYITDEWSHYADLFNTGKAHGKSIICLLQDSKNRLWIGSEGNGIAMFDFQNKIFTNIVTTKEGLPNNVIYKLIDDGRDIWGSTNKGIFRYNTETQKTSVFTHMNGLLGDQFNYKSGIKASNGEIYFGGIKGFISFNPNKLIKNNTIPPVLIKELRLKNEVVEINKHSILKESIINTKTISIPSKSSNFSLEFVSLSYVSPFGNFYSYKLDGFDSDWSNPTSQNKVSYSDLPAGNYTFRVKASNNDLVWNEEGTALQIKILPPWYKNIWAYVAYLLTFILISYYTIRRLIIKSREKQENQLKEYEKNKEFELYNAKIDFFTNVTHEIRTPLTLIKLPLDEVISNTKKSDDNFDDLKIIQKNVTHLYNLVNELLDFKKIDANKYKLYSKNYNIIEIINQTVENYRPSARLQNIKFSHVTELDSLDIYVDKELFMRILNNLLSNALKHSKTVVEIISELKSDEMFTLTINNDGNKIPEEYIDKIFEPFFKIDPNKKGTGIGLSFAKTLVELHGGSIFLNSTYGDYTSFVVELPLYQNHSNSIEEFQEEQTIQSKLTEIDASNKLYRESSKPTILLVEDNIEFLTFLSKQLEPLFNILRADNGKLALELLASNQVDLIISDIMMPEMDGMELCDKIKSNLITSHIPIILLTAKTNIESKLDSLKIGADEYIEKPYQKEYLIARIHNLIESRKKLRELYKNYPDQTYMTLAHNKIDEYFISKLVNIIHENIENADLSVDYIAELMNMSRATLYRKINNISELTPNEFIQLTRLKKGAELLKQRKYRINEISYMVGFSSPNYFSKCFIKQFGVLPKDFITS